MKAQDKKNRELEIDLRWLIEDISVAIKDKLKTEAKISEEYAQVIKKEIEAYKGELEEILITNKIIK